MNQWGKWVSCRRILPRLNNVNSGAALLSYDPLGRLAKVDATNDVLFLYDGGDLIAEYSTGGTVLRRYVHGPNYDEPLVWYEGSGTGDKRYYVSDQLGSIVAVTNSSGAAMDMGSGVYTKVYDEYGNPGPVVAFGRFAFTGQTYVPEAGAYYYKARFYSPTLGRFLSPDPIGYGDGANMYAYVGNDPVNMLDVWGLCGGPRGPACPDEGNGITPEALYAAYDLCVEARGDDRREIARCLLALGFYLCREDTAICWDPVVVGSKTPCRGECFDPANVDLFDGLLRGTNVDAPWGTGTPDRPVPYFSDGNGGLHPTPAQRERACRTSDALQDSQRDLGAGSFAFGVGDTVAGVKFGFKIPGPLLIMDVIMAGVLTALSYGEGAPYCN